MQTTAEYITYTSVKERGWTDKTILSMLGDADKYRRNPHYRSGPPMRLYRLDRVTQAESTPEWKAWFNRLALIREAKKAKKTLRDEQAEEEKKARLLESKAEAEARIKARDERIRQKYGSWENALPDACAYMFELNRYAKQPRCSREQRNEIYTLKNGLIRVLYQNGHAAACYKQSTETEPSLCWDCDGDGDGCPKCGESGVYRPGGTLHFLCFSFDVAGKKYSWHQPLRSVDFTYAVTTTEDIPFIPRDDDDEEKEVKIKASAIPEAKAVIRWLVNSARRT